MENIFLCFVYFCDKFVHIETNVKKEEKSLEFLLVDGLDAINGPIELTGMVRKGQAGPHFEYISQIDLNNNIYNYYLKLDTTGHVAVVAFDLSKAFDKIPFESILETLEMEYAVPTHLISGLESYLNNRHYQVRVGTAFSSKREVLSGVPQGSTLSPLLFNAYSATIAKLDLHLDLLLFADDITLIKSLENSSEFKKLQADITSVSDMIKLRHLSLNATKKRIMICSHSSQQFDALPSITIDNTNIEKTESIKHLGVTFDQHLSFNTQAIIAATKAKRAIGALHHHFSNYTPKLVLEPIYRYCILPSLLYGSSVWWPKAAYSRQLIEKSQRYFLKILTNNYTAPYNYLLSTTGYKPIWHQTLENDLMLLYNYVNKTHSIPTEHISFNTNRHSKRLNNNKSIDIFSFHDSQSISSTFLFRSAKIWNTMPNEIITLPRKLFKKYLQSPAFATFVQNTHNIACEITGTTRFNYPVLLLFDL